MQAFPQGDPARAVDRRMALSRRWDELVEQVRQLPGFADFLRPPGMETLREAAAEGPVIVVNVSRWRCDAIVVTPGGAEAVPLPDLTLAEVTRQVAEYLQLQLELDGGVPSTSDTARLSFEEQLSLRDQARQERETRLHDIMAWLWDVIADPVLRALGLDRTPPPGTTLPRVWWCLTGQLSLLPLHGAGRHGPPGSDLDQAVLGRVISSYTPTLRALRQARLPGIRSSAHTSQLLVVAVPDAPGELRLEEAAEESALLQAMFGPACLVLEGDAATGQAVTQAMADHPWVHFSCHGSQNLNEPSRGGLLLADGMLTVLDLSRAAHGGEFAFLSACKTATGGLTLPDEAITLAAALHYTGYRQVVATLWSVDPAIAADLTRAVYSRLNQVGRFAPEQSAWALHEALTELRRRPDVGLRDWLPFAHIGP